MSNGLEQSVRLQQLQAKLGTSTTIVVISVFLLFASLHTKAFGASRVELGLLIAELLIALLAGALFGSLTAKHTHKPKPLLLMDIVTCTTLFVFVPFMQSTTSLIPLLIGLAFALGPVIPLLYQIAPSAFHSHTSLYSRLWLWEATGWVLAAILLAWLGGRFGLQTLFFGLALLMYVVLLTADRLGKGPGRDQRA